MAKNVERLQAREAKELIRREKQLGARSNKFYLIYLFMILSLIYITDEIASTISIQFQANIVTEFFVKNMGMEYGAGLSLFSAIGFISYPVTLLIIFYRPLADKFGRKPFLVINTLCMGLGLFLVYLSKNIYVYMIGGTLMSFMVSHDMQCVYILECSDKKSRARNYAIVKAVAILGTLLVPLLRATLMQNVSERWHVVYLVPAIIGFVMSLFALLFARETNAFLTKRIEYLKTPIEEREQRSKEGREQNAQGGILTAVKFAFRHRQLRFLIIACCCFYLASLGTATYSTVMAKSALMTEEEITLALFLYPVGNALFTLISGFVSDKFGRKVTIVAMSCSALTCYLLFIFSGMFKWTPYLTGFAIGGFMGSYWGAGDTIGGIMFSESTPTNLRSSVTVINTLLNGVMGGLATVITMILLPIIPESMFGYMYLGLTVPGLVGAIVIMWLFVGETRGLDLKTVTGTEWDKPKRLKKNKRTVNKMNNKQFEIGASEQPLDIIKETCGFAGIFKQIGVIGDSLASGEFESHDENGNIVYTDMYEYSWPAVLERITGTKYNNYSRGGMTAREYVQSWADTNGFWQWNQAYIIALGNNDSFVFGHPLGSVKDVNADCPQDNGDTFFGNMGKIVSKLKTIEPNARIFVVTPQLRGEACDNDIRYIASELAKLCDMFEFTYLLDMTAHAPVYDAEMRKSFGLGFHPNPMGYYAYALIVGNYIDYIIRSNPQEFATIPFVGTLLKNKDYK